MSKALPFITLPITTRFLTKEQISLLGIYSIIISMYSLCSQFGLTYVINSQWFKLANENRKVLLFNLFVINLILSTFSIFLFLLLQNKLTPLLIGDVWLNFKELSLFIIIQIFSVGFKSLFD